jgi:hypothetical protein
VIPEGTWHRPLKQKKALNKRRGGDRGKAARSFGQLMGVCLQAAVVAAATSARGSFHLLFSYVCFALNVLFLPFELDFLVNIPSDVRIPFCSYLFLVKCLTKKWRN